MMSMQNVSLQRGDRREGDEKMERERGREGRKEGGGKRWGKGRGVGVGGDEGRVVLTMRVGRNTRQVSKFLFLECMSELCIYNVLL